VVECYAYFDTSLIVPLYRAEDLTAEAESLSRKWRPVISLLTEVEIASTIARWVRTGELGDDQAARVEKTFAEDLRLNVFDRAEIQDRHYWQARAWLQRKKTSLRTLDALHLAIAAEAGWPMITADKQLHEAATTLKLESQLAEPGNRLLPGRDG